ncbi:MAG: c-type cytochrome [Fuerstiella sp.]|nr:c-type cytochrome [Fuerstiella sp.]
MPATEHFFRNQNKLHWVFAISCVVLLASVVVMMVEDYSDEWRGYQSTAIELEAAVRDRDIQAMKTEQFEAQRESLQEQQRDIKKQLEPFADLQEQLASEENGATRLFEARTLELKNANAGRDEKRADYDLSIRDNLTAETQARLKHAYDEQQALCDSIQLELEAAQRAVDAVGNPEHASGSELAGRLTELNEILQQSDDVNSGLDKLEADVVLAEAALQKIKPTDDWAMQLKRSFMEIPIVEGFNGHLKVTQDWLPELSVTLGMTSIARFDRCRTCHINVDRTAAGNVAAFPHGESETDDIATWVADNEFPHPFATHPNHDLFVTAASPHPLGTFGCTSCHEGQGSGTDFLNAEHGPNDPHQAEQWHEEHGYHPNHFWEYPMRPNRFQESTCLKCHHSVTELGVNPRFGASAPKVYEGFNLIRKYGCFGCHEIHGFDGGDAIGPDMRLEPQTPEDAQRIADDPTQRAGKFRKVGPSLRHIAAKTSAEFIAYWTEIPNRFRPTTKMPQFFDLSNQDDAEAQTFEAVELAGIAQVLIGDSEAIELLHPAAEYVPNAERGKQLFSERGCLACHEHAAVPGTTADFGPNISDIHKKINRNKDNPAFSDWLYTWVKEPERHHKRTRMPNLFLEPYASGEEQIDPAADIVAFLLSQGEPQKFEVVEPSDTALDELVTLFLKKARFSEDAVKEILRDQKFPQKAGDVAGDERVLATEDGSAVAEGYENDWQSRKLEYIGRRTISRYGCYGCHDISGYEDARPIGVALQDWGRKDTSKLGLEHIEEFLHHHGEPDGSSTRERVAQALRDAESGAEGPDDERLSGELTQAYFYESLLHHGRPGFLWQKLRGPRTYDYLKTDTKGYDERLRMPKFPLKEDEVEAIATFVLGLVAEPPAERYVYTPNVRDANRIEGEFLLAKYNCTSCHMVELPKVTFGVDVDEDVFPTQLGATDHEDALALLLEMRKPRSAFTGQIGKFTIDGEEVDLPLASFHGIRMVDPDPEEEDPEYRESGYDTWENLDFGNAEDPKRVLSSSRITISDAKHVDYQPARGGAFTEWLVKQLLDQGVVDIANLAWQASPPPLHQEGLKVQNSWLYQFLLEPDRLRYTTVLRMPRFNMSPKEAQTLANYFAAVDGAEFPYQEQEPTEPGYLAQKQDSMREEGLLGEDQLYLDQCWNIVNAELCIGCHSVGGRKYQKSNDPTKKDIQGPNLNRVANRLRSDWVRLWLYNPKWITPYTSMPSNFLKNAKKYPEIFGGEAGHAVEGTVDALMNYPQLMEDVGPTVYTGPGAAPVSADKPANAASGAEE